MKRFYIFFALLIWLVLVLNVSTVSNLLGFYQFPTYDITGAQLVERSQMLRQQIIAYFPSETHPIVRAEFDKPRVHLALKNMLENAKQKYYAGDKLVCSEQAMFFQRERETLKSLMELGCMLQVELPEGYAYGGVRVVTSTKFPPQHFQDTGVASCNTALKDIARTAIADLMEANLLLAEGTDAAILCREDEVAFSMMLAKENIRNGDIFSELNNYESAIRKSMSCVCP